MKNKLFTIIAAFVSAVIMLTGSAAVVNAEGTVDDVQNVIDGILAFKLSGAEISYDYNSPHDSLQRWIDGELADSAGVTSDWYALTLSHGGYDFDRYEAALLGYLKSQTINSASSRLKYALVLHSIGSDDGYIVETLSDSIGKQGIMSWIYGLHLLNNGVPCDEYTAESVTDILLSLQLADGGWALSGDTGDVDVTAMTTQALAPQYENNPEVKSAVDGALELLSARQQEDGGYKSYGVGNPESAAQVLTALSSLGIDCAEDERFIKNENTVIDGIIKYRLDDGSFSHTDGGDYNHMSTVQAYYSLVSYLRMKNGESLLYIFGQDESGEAVPEAETIAEAETETKAETISESEAIDKTEPEPVSETAEVLPETDETTPKAESKIGYKPICAVVIVILGAAVCLVLVVAGKRNPKNFIAVLIVCALAVIVVFATDFQTAENYYNGEDAAKENPIGTVTITIRCDTIVGKAESEYIPSDGVILETTEFAIEEGDSVYDILTEAARKFGIQMENNGSYDMVYIAGINYLYEFDFGDLSGWIYRVNGVAPSVGSSEYILADGDAIEWLYTCDLGNDLD